MHRPADHPRPLLRRDAWRSLDGEWEFAWDPDGRLRTPADVRFDQRIRVPFAPETPASGLGAMQPHRACWYRRRFRAPERTDEQRLILRFGAVDHAATVWVNGHQVASHEGGYTPFSADITDALADGEQELVVRALDDPRDLEQPRGKQEWGDQPHGIWYPRTTGIWQTVWLEPVGATAISALHWHADLLDWAVDVEVELDGIAPAAGAELEVTVRHGDRVLGRSSAALERAGAKLRVTLPDPGVGDERRQLMWSPENPALFDADVVLRSPDGELDRVRSYTAMRTVGVTRGRFTLNGRPLQLRLVLDQGYWPETGLTPPDADALYRDVELVQALGFNGVRKHQKIEDPRFLRIADERGLLVWEELPSAYRFTSRSVQRLTQQCVDVVRRDSSHPCIVAWVPFNESWGISAVAADGAQRDLMAALYHLTRALDPNRPVIGNDGWEFAAGDMLGVHDYDSDAGRLARRYAQPLATVLREEQPGGRVLLLDGAEADGRPVLLTEFGGIAHTPEADEQTTWGYDRARTGEELATRYERLLEAVHGAVALAGFCYTQLTDTYQEANGLLTMERTPKAPLERLAAATRGDRRAH